VSGRHHALDLLRGLAAILVAASHFLDSQGVAVESLGTFSVYVFFVLSGVTMMAVYGPRFSNAISAIDLRRFYWNRITRIMPLLIAASLVSLALAASSLGFTRHLAASALYAFMTGTALFALHLPGYLSNTIGAWSLGIEMMFYFVFPVICLLAATASLLQLAGIALVLIFAQQVVIALMHHWVSDDPLRFWHYYSTFLIYLPFFILGILIAKLRAEPKYRNLAAALVLLAAIAGFSLVFKVEIFETHWAYLTLTGVTFCAVYFAFMSRTPEFLVGASLFLGNASYALYLSHPFSLRLAADAANLLGYGPLVTAVLFFPLALMAAHAIYRLFERPAQNYLRSTTARHGFSIPAGPADSRVLSAAGSQEPPC
jgi:peptidoglycan/LPS O-acetylase OafA/YrhL